MWHASTCNSSCLLLYGKFTICYLFMSGLFLAWALWCWGHVEGQKPYSYTVNLLKGCSVTAFLLTIERALWAWWGWCDWGCGRQHLSWSVGIYRDLLFAYRPEVTALTAVQLILWSSWLDIWLSATQCGSGMGPILVHTSMLLVWI